MHLQVLDWHKGSSGQVRSGQVPHNGPPARGAWQTSPLLNVQFLIPYKQAISLKLETSGEAVRQHVNSLGLGGGSGPGACPAGRWKSGGIVDCGMETVQGPPGATSKY